MDEYTEKIFSFINDYPIEQAYVHLDLLSYFSQWLNTADYDYLDKMILLFSEFNIPIKGVALKEVAQAAADRLGRVVEVKDKYKTDKKRNADKISVLYETNIKVFQLVELCGIERERACYLVANWLDNKYGVIPTFTKKATTIDKEYKNWLSKMRKARLKALEDHSIFLELGTEEQINQFLKRIQTIPESLKSMSNYKQWSDEERKMKALLFLEGIEWTDENIVSTEFRKKLKPSLRGDWTNKLR
jgi:hypothetical protein